MNTKKEQQLSKLVWITNIFEKEIIMFVYYALFTLIAFDTGILNIQFLFFGIGTILQIYLKFKKKLSPWNNFTACTFFILGSAFSYNENFFFSGFLIFIFSVSLFALLYEQYIEKIGNKFFAIIFQFLYSAIVLMSFPVLYFIFMKNKLNIDLQDFFQDQNHLIVFSGYFVFYILILLNKQLLAIQTTLLKDKN